MVKIRLLGRRPDLEAITRELRRAFIILEETNRTANRRCLNYAELSERRYLIIAAPNQPKRLN